MNSPETGQKHKLDYMMVVFVARAIEQVSHEQWKALSEEKRAELITLARRAINAMNRYVARTEPTNS